MQQEAQALTDAIRRFSLSGDPLSTATAQSFVDAFVPLSNSHSLRLDKLSSANDAQLALATLKQARSTALVTLASRSGSQAPNPARASKQSLVDENISQLLTPVIRSRLADTTPHSLLAALHFLAALFSVLPTEAHHILLAEGVLDLVLQAPEACNNALPHCTRDATASASIPPSASSPLLSLSDEQLVSLAVAELLSSAANSAATRKSLASQQALLDWLDIASVPRNSTSSLTSSDSEHKSDAVAILSGLADVKLHRATASEDIQALSQPVSSQPTSHQHHIRKIQHDKAERRRKDRSLFDAIQMELLARSSSSPSIHTSPPLDQAVHAEIDRIVNLGCLEALAYLTVQPAFKQCVAADSKLLAALCKSFDLAAPKNDQASKPVDMDDQRFDGALQLGLATVLSNLARYPKTLTSEEKQIQRLRKFANAQDTDPNDTQADDDDELESTPQAEKRCSAILEAGGVATLCALALAGRAPITPADGARQPAPGWRVNPSKSVRAACADALLSLLTKQDRLTRGKAVQQGALKAALALSAPVLQDLLSGQPDPDSSGLFSRAAKASAASVTSQDLAPMQALAKLLISLNPSLLFPSQDALLSVAPVVCSLLLAPAASQLQQFEALLALTNLASLSPQIGSSIAAFSLDRAASDKAAKDSSTTFSSTSVLAKACEQLLIEDKAMLRRAWIELMVNLLQIEEVFDYFVAAGPAEIGHVQGPSALQTRLVLRLRTLVSLSEVDEWAYANRAGAEKDQDEPTSSSNAGGGEPSLATRMASLAILAMVTDSRSTVRALLSLERLFPVLVSNLLLDRSEDDERNQWERADLRASSAGQLQSEADVEAHFHLNAINLSLRAGYVILNMLQHIKDDTTVASATCGGLDRDALRTALRQTLNYHVAQCKTAKDADHVDEARKGLLQVLADCLKVT